MQEASHAFLLPWDSGSLGKAQYRHYNQDSTPKSCKRGSRQAHGVQESRAGLMGPPHPRPRAASWQLPPSPFFSKVGRTEGTSEHPVNRLSWGTLPGPQDGPEAFLPFSK